MTRTEAAHEPPAPDHLAELRRLAGEATAECDAVCTSGCHADDCEHHGHLPQRLNGSAPSADLAAIAKWWATSHTQEAGHDHHCWGKTECICGWRDAKNALDNIIAAPSEGSALLEAARREARVRTAAGELVEWAQSLCDEARAGGRHDRECPVDRARAALQDNP